MISYEQSMVEGPAGAETPPDHGPTGGTPVDTTKDTAPRRPDHEKIRRDVVTVTTSSRTCRECGGFGAFWWGTAKVAECTACRGTGRQ